MSGISRDLSGIDLATLNTASRDALRVFAAAGFDVVEPGQLLDAENLLDLYGEDVRARAFVFSEGNQRDLCLRPDLTLPLCRLHLTGAPEAEAKYAASGSVFRQSAHAGGRAAEFRQIGCEWYGAQDSASAEAEIFRLTRDALAAMGVAAPGVTTGDLGIPFALIDAAPMPERSRARLKRHFWRNEHFMALLKNMGEPAQSDPGRAGLFRALSALEPTEATAAVEQMFSMQQTVHVGLRSPTEIANRLLEQAEDKHARPVPSEVVSAIEQANRLRAPSGEALAQLRAIATGCGLDITQRLDHFEARLAALDAQGIDAAALPYDGQFGRDLEYYDGFVFEFFEPSLAATNRREAQLAGGGRYDQLLPVAARAFGVAEPRAVAIGAALRPETALRFAGERS